MIRPYYDEPISAQSCPCTDPTYLLTTEDWPTRLGTRKRALQVHRRDDIKVLIRHLLEALVPQDTGIVDQDVHRPERLDSLRDNLVALGDGSGGSSGFAACLLDLLDDLGAGFG